MDPPDKHLEYADQTQDLYGGTQEISISEASPQKPSHTVHLKETEDFSKTTSALTLFHCKVKLVSDGYQH